MRIWDEISEEAGRRVKAPAGWEPYAEAVGDQVGKAVVKLPRPGATEDDLLASAGFDPSAWRIRGPINTRKWMSFEGEWLYYYKFDVVAGSSPAVVKAHVDELVRLIRRRRPVERPRSTSYDAWAWFISDTQIGKAEGEIGTDQIVERYLDALAQGVRRVKDLRRIGRGIKTIAIVGLGDIVEGCFGNYPNQQFLTDRNDRDQDRIARELIYRTIDAFDPLAELVVACVAGNHGENRVDLKAKKTDDADNRDVSCFEAVKEAFDRAGRDDIRWHIPQGELSSRIELGGVGVGLTHGHIFRKGATPQQKAVEWFKGADFGFGPVRGARVLVSGHFHHYLATQVGSRTLLQAPAMDAGSKWYEDATGEASVPAVLTCRFDAEHPMGYDDVALLSPRGV